MNVGLANEQENEQENELHENALRLFQTVIRLTLRMINL